MARTEPGVSKSKAVLRQWLHFFTGDREREAAALAASVGGEAPESELESKAREAVRIAHGDPGVPPEAGDRPSDHRAQDAHREVGADKADEDDVRVAAEHADEDDSSTGTQQQPQ